MRNRGLVYALPLLFLVIPAAAHAASTLNFPRLAFESGRFTGIAIANPSTTDAIVTLTAYGEDGKPLAGNGFVNPAQLTIKPNQQIAKLTSEIFGAGLSSSTIGWMQATSPADGLAGFFLFLDSSITFLDGADLPVSAQKITFQQVRTGSGFSSEIDIINPSTAVANVQVELVSAGAARVTKLFTLPAKGVKRFDAGAFFGVADVSAGAYVLVQSSTEIGGTEFVKNPQGELLGLNARAVSEQLDRLVFPQLAVLGDYKTDLGVINYSTDPAILTITAFRADGTLFDTSDLNTNPVTRTLDGGASLREDVGTMFGFSGSRTLTGWIEVKSTAVAINGYVTFGIPGSGAAAAVATAAKGRTRAIFSHIATAGYFTGIAALNPGSLTANIRIVALKPSGEILGSYDGVLQPGARISQLIGSELIPEAANQNGGLIWVKSDLPIYLAEIFGSNEVLANVPPQDAPAGFAPDAGLAALRVKPPLVVLRPNQSQAFQIEGGSGTLDWKVNGRLGGQGATGTISPAGIFTAPSSVPARQVVAITAENSKQAVGASVDVLDKTTVAGSFRVVQSVAFLSALGKLYAAEFAALSGFQADPHAVENGSTQVLEVSPSGAKISIVNINENIRKLVPFTGRDGREYLLMSGQIGGRIIRLNPATREMRDVVTGLKEPSALVLDPSTGDLLVAERDKITTVARSVLDAGLSATAALSDDGRDPYPGGRVGALPPSILVSGAAGLAVDRCTGKIYFTVPSEGTLLEYDPSTGRQRTVLSGLRDPGAQLALYRSGGSCPNAFQILVSERGSDRTILWISGDPTFIQWIAAAGVNDLLLLPATNPFTPTEGVIMGENAGSAGSLSIVPTAHLYAAAPANPPVTAEEGPTGGTADLAVTATVTPEPVSVTGTLTFIYTVTNRGPAGATGVNLVLTATPLAALGVPNVSASVGQCGATGTGIACVFPSLAANARAVVTISVPLYGRPPDGILTTTATAVAEQVDGDVTNNTATTRTTISGGGSSGDTSLPRRPASSP